MTIIEPGGRVEQSPDATVSYTVSEAFTGAWWADVAVRSVRPSTLALEALHVSVQREQGKRLVVVAGGQAGAIYGVRLGGQAFAVRIAHARTTPATPATPVADRPRIRVVV
jgi:hypothetical protein